MPTINQSSFIDFSRIKLHGRRYDLCELFKFYKFDVDKASAKYSHWISDSEILIMLWLMHCVEECQPRCQPFYSHLTFAVSESLFCGDRLSPLLSTVQVKPDTLMKIAINDKSVVIFSIEK